MDIALVVGTGRCGSALVSRILPAASKLTKLADFLTIGSSVAEPRCDQPDRSRSRASSGLDPLLMILLRSARVNGTIADRLQVPAVPVGQR